jgi:restriction endonuclease-like protein
VDIVAEREEDGARVAVECDGERYHLDEHGALKVEDLERQAIVERAGWRVVRVPYRKWITDPGGEVQRVLAAVDVEARDELNGNGDSLNELDEPWSGMGTPPPTQRTVTPAVNHATPPLGSQQRVTREEAALIDALRDGGAHEEDIFLRVRDLLGRKVLTQKLYGTLRDAAADLTRRRLIASEYGEYFLLPEGRMAQLQVYGTSAASIRRWSSRARRYSPYRQRWR